MDQETDTPPTPVTFTPAEAADAVGKSRATIMGRLKAGAFPNAVQGDDRSWTIPASDLEAAGFTLRRPPAQDDVPTPAPVTAEPSRVSELTAERDELAHEVELLTLQLSAAERLIAAQREALDTLRLAFRALPAGDPPAPATVGGQEARSGVGGPPVAPGPERGVEGGWWSRLFGTRRYHSG